MNRHLAEIETRRAHLLERASREREDVDQTLRSMAQPLGFIDRCVDAVRFVASRPPLVAGIALVFTLLRPRSALRWARRGWGIWQGYRWLTRARTA